MPKASIIPSLWPSQKTSVSIIQAAARRHIEHGMICMVDLKKKKDALRVPPLLELRGYYATDFSIAACIAFASFWKTSKLGMRSSDGTPRSSRMV